MCGTSSVTWPPLHYLQVQGHVRVWPTDCRGHPREDQRCLQKFFPHGRSLGPGPHLEDLSASLVISVVSESASAGTDPHPTWAKVGMTEATTGRQLACLPPVGEPDVSASLSTSEHSVAKMGSSNIHIFLNQPESCGPFPLSSPFL